MKKSELKAMIKEEVNNAIIRLFAEGTLQEVVMQGIKEALKEVNASGVGYPGGRDSSGGQQIGVPGDLFSSTQPVAPRMKRNLDIPEDEKDRFKRLVGQKNESRSRFKHTNKTQAEILAERKMAMAETAPGMEQQAMQQQNAQQSQQQFAFAPSTKAAPPQEPPRQAPDTYPGYD